MPERPSQSLPLALILLALSGLSLFAAGYPFFKDSGELAASLATAGISHPTGFAGQHALARLFAILPLGSLPFRLALVSALGGAIALCLLVVLAGRLTGERSSERAWWHGVPLLAAGAGALLGATNWFHTVNIEVYVPSLAFSAALLTCCVSVLIDGSKNRVALLCLLAGFSVGMHITCVMVAGVCVLFAVLRLIAGEREAGKTLRAFVWPGAFLAVAGALVVVYLPIRSAAAPIRDWGHPATVLGFLGHMSGRSIRSSFSSQMLQTDWGHISAHLRLYMEQIGAQVGFALVPASFGVAGALRSKALRLPCLLLLVVWLADGAFSVFINPMAQKEMQTSSLSFFVAMVFAGAGSVRLLSGLAKRMPPRLGQPGRALATAILCALLLVSPVTSESLAQRASRTRPVSYELGLRAFRSLGPETLLVTGEDDLSAMSLYLSEVECRRPDLLPVVKQMTCEPSLMEPLYRRFSSHPLTPWFQAAGKTGCRTGTGRDILELWGAFAQSCPTSSRIGWELSDGAVDSVWGTLLEPWFPVFSARCGQEPVRAALAASQGQSEYRAFVRPLLERGLDPISRGVLSEWGRLASAWFMKRGRMTDGQWMRPAMSALEDAASLTPGNCRVLNNLAVGLSAQARYADAVLISQRAVEHCPLYVTAAVNLIRFHILAGQRGRAVAAATAVTQRFEPDEYRPLLLRLQRQMEDLGRTDDASLLGQITADQ